MNPDIDLILDFLHTRQSPDELATPAQLSAWLTTHGLTTSSPPTVEEIAQARHLRAALTTVFMRGEAAWNDDRTRHTIEAATSAAPLRIVRGERGAPELASVAGGVAGAFAAIVAAYYRIIVRGQCDRLKCCAGCGWGFYDVSKNNSRRWCDMATCGAQHKSRDYRRRLAAEKLHP